MMPDREKVRLACLHFVPKPHKVNFIISSDTLKFAVDYVVERDSVTSYRLIDQCTHNWHIENVRHIDSALVRQINLTENPHR